MDIQFEVTFLEGNGKRIRCEHFYEQHHGQHMEKVTTLTENTNLSLLFQAPSGYRLYMDGIDNLPGSQVADDENGTYIEPSSHPYNLCDFNLKNSEYPFIPGTYFLFVISPEGTRYGTRVNVATKQVSEDQHQLMISDIETFLKGLSIDFSQKRSIYYSQAVELFDRQSIKKYSYILNNKNKIIHGLAVVSKNRRYTIHKSYPIVPRTRAKRIDHQSIKYMIMHPEQQSTVQVPQSVVSYQTSENSWLKHIVQLILRHVNEMKKICDANRIQKFEGLTKEVNDLYYHLLQFLNERWVLDLKNDLKKPIPMAFLSVGQYNLFYKIYRFLTNDTVETTIGLSKQFHYKRSDVLYEIWGYLKVIQSFMRKHDFQMKHNWFRTNRTILDDVIVPQISEYDMVELEKGEVVLRIYYDEILPRKKEVSLQRTLYNMNHNRPDCRIDVWEKGKFKGALIIDFKYRKKYWLWDDRLLNEDRAASKVMQQLASYANGMRTDTEKLNGEKDRGIDRSPVFEAWAVYPQKNNSEIQDYELNDQDVRLVDLTPGQFQEHFEDLLANRIDALLNR